MSDVLAHETDVSPTSLSASEASSSLASPEASHWTPALAGLRNDGVSQETAALLASFRHIGGPAGAAPESEVGGLWRRFGRIQEQIASLVALRERLIDQKSAAARTLNRALEMPDADDREFLLSLAAAHARIDLVDRARPHLEEQIGRASIEAAGAKQAAEEKFSEYARHRAALRAGWTMTDGTLSRDQRAQRAGWCRDLAGPPT